MPTTRFPQFTVDLQRARELVGLGQALAGLTVGTVDATDLYRAALVQGVAALDAYIHDILLDRIVDILLGRRPAGTSTRVGLHFGAISTLLSATNPTDRELLSRAVVNNRLSKETFQRPEAIADGLALAGVSGIWNAAFGPLAGQIKVALGVVVQRRNLIAHRCDADPSNPGTLVALSDADALDAIKTVEDVVVAIDTVL